MILIFRKYFPIALVIALIPQLVFERYEWSLGWAFRFDTLIWGVLLALVTDTPWIKKLKPSLMQYRWLRWLLIPALIFGMAFIPEYSNRIWRATSLLGFICLALVFLASYDSGFLMKESIFRRILLWFGSRSYSLYLIHIFCFRIAYELVYQMLPTGYAFSIDDITKIIVVAFSLLFLLSEINYRWIEIPFRNYGSRLSAKILKS